MNSRVSQGFWPESYISSASEASGVDQDGVNVWVALDDIPVEYAGSMALSAGFHEVPWRFEAYVAMGQNRTVDGGRSKHAILAGIEEKRSSGEASLGACQIGVSRPDLGEKLEAKKVVLDIRKGDIVFSTRTLFHRTTDVTDAGKVHYKSMGKHA
jgi:ectoine hydroxylase-related dioxygenase (phytanoyl-CoA dioxygenase family)